VVVAAFGSRPRFVMWRSLVAVIDPVDPS